MVAVGLGPKEWEVGQALIQTLLKLGVAFFARVLLQHPVATTNCTKYTHRRYLLLKMHCQFIDAIELQSLVATIHVSWVFDCSDSVEHYLSKTYQSAYKLS